MNLTAITSHAAAALAPVAIVWGLAWAILIRWKNLRTPGDSAMWHFLACLAIATALHIADEMHPLFILIVCIASVAFLRGRSKPAE